MENKRQMLKVRGFEKVSLEEYTKHETDLIYEDLVLPKRGTANSAGYDMVSTKTFTLKPGQTITVPTGIKSYMQEDEYLGIQVRSGVGFKFQVCLANTEGIIDADYYNNEANEGHIMLRLVNRGEKVWEVKAGDRIVQAIFRKYLLVDGDDFVGETRIGGIHSTGK